MRVGVLFATLSSVLAVKEWMFRKCDQNPFCKRNRLYAEHAGTTAGFESPYEVDPKSVKISANTLSGIVTNDGNKFPFVVEIITDNTIHLLIDEQGRKEKLKSNKETRELNPERFDPAPYMLDYTQKDSWKPTKLVESQVSDSQAVLKYGGRNEIVVNFKPFQAVVYKDGLPQVYLNKNQFLNIEALRQKPDFEGEEWKGSIPEWLSEDDSKAMWEDKFDGSTDPKIRGPESLAMDTTFEGYSHVYGIPEHADRFSLKDTHVDQTDPYRLFNVDIFEYETESPLPMYGSIPFMLAQKKGGSAGVFWLNAADTYIDISKDTASHSTTSHWISETGKLDTYVFLGDHPEEVLHDYGKLTGYLQLPQLFAIGYHQCRWNYNSQADVLEVNEEFDRHEIPYDVIWLDIDYTVRRKYFTWLESMFPDPEAMMAELAQSGRKLVAIIDPHIKVESGYNVYETIRDKSIAILDQQGKSPFQGHCWPGDSVWIDTLNPASTKYWTQFFAMGGDLGGYAKNLHIWNDMNEPSVFSGAETTAYKSLIHHGGWQHRDVHNYYGQTLVNATYDALLSRYNHEQRPFILTRSFFAGSQKLAAMWTGDNQAEWQYLQAATPMVLTMGISGMPYAGADVGGFFRDPNSELITRWYQAGAFYPFFRGHAHIDSKRREPYLIEKPFNETIARAIELRYQLLPTIYTAFWQASQTLAPIIRPLFWIDETDESILAVDDQFMLGDALMVKPVVTEGARSVQVLAPTRKDSIIWYDYFTGARFKGGEVPVDITTIPLYIKGGHVVFRKDRHRRSAELMRNDPYTLVIALDNDSTAEGTVYVDDGISFEYETKDDFLTAQVKFANGKIHSTVTHPAKGYFAKNTIERIIVYGPSSVLSKYTEAQAGTRTLDVSSQAAALVIRNPAVEIGREWTINLRS